VFNRRVGTTWLLEGRYERSLGCVGSPDVTLYGHDVHIGGRLGRPRCCNNPLVTIPESLKDTRTDPLRCARYYGYFLLCAHDCPRSKESFAQSDLRLTAGHQRIVFRPFQDRMELSSPDADVTSAKQRKRERILQQAPQREGMIVALYPDDS